MTAYRLSPIRNKGWFRLGLVGAGTMVPWTVMEHALGHFSEGPQGVQQIAEFFFGGVILWLILGAATGWAIHGFVIRMKEEDDHESGHRSGGMGGSSPASHAPARSTPPAAAHGKPPGH